MTETKTGGSRRVPNGKRQMLCILDEDVIERVKIVAVRSNARVSHVVEQALREWLERLETEGPNKGEAAISSSSSSSPR